MGKIMSFVMMALMGLLQFGADLMFVSVLKQDFEWHDYLVCFGGIVVVTVWGFKSAWNEWREECNK